MKSASLSTVKRHVGLRRDEVVDRRELERWRGDRASAVLPRSGLGEGAAGSSFSRAADVSTIVGSLGSLARPLRLVPDRSLRLYARRRGEREQAPGSGVSLGMTATSFVAGSDSAFGARASTKPRTEPRRRRHLGTSRPAAASGFRVDGGLDHHDGVVMCRIEVDARQSSSASRLPPSSRSRSRAVFHASATVFAPAAVPSAPFALQRPTARTSKMKENAARAMRMSPRQAKPTRKEPIVEKSERPSSPKSSPTSPAAL